ncbi:hypothetical protein OG741_35815 [Streptomyces sp. NBC_01410]|uniref:hypothetical protein n=1 Tax=Streptomyces sp. NBC_01410 TaxID=2903856 RepID=UPI00325651DB
MSAPAEHSPAPAGGGPSRRALLATKRQSRRPSRLGVPAGATPKPDRVFEEDAGFAGLLKRAWQQAVQAPDLRTAVDTLLTLGGHVPADIQLRALRTADGAALKVLCGLSWRPGEEYAGPAAGTGGEPAFLGELGLTTSGRIVVRVPSQGPLASREQLVGGSLRVPWSGQDLLDYRSELERATARLAEAAADCRAWLASAGPAGRSELLEQLKEAALRTAPFVLYQEDKQYTNFRDRNTVTGKTLWPGHPDCSLSSLQGLPLPLWSDNDAVMVVCLTLLVRSAGFGRIEEANGTQLSLDHIALLLERTRRNYNSALDGHALAPAASARVEDLEALAGALREKRQQVAKSVQLYREIHGALMHKIERVAAPYGEGARLREEALCARLREQLPLSGATLDDLGAEVEASPGWLTQPHGSFGTGLESLVYEAVSASAQAFRADFAMSRGIRSLPRLIQALRAQDWAEITQWGITDFFCCVVPLPEARTYFAGSTAQLADTAWAMSSRMQYNSWHFIAGNLPKVPEVTARDHFVPPTIPDIAFYSDQHHHGHVANRVRFSIRSPQAVDVLDRAFNGFMDLRLLRCEGPPFDEQDVLAAHRTSAFVARATSSAARLVAEGEGIEVTSFDSAWHWATIAGAEAAEAAAP